MQYLGDFAEDATVYIFFATAAADGGREGFSSALETADVEVIKDGSTTGSTAGVTITNDFDSKTGIHKIEVDMSADAFYATGSDYALLVYPDETIDSQSVAGVVAQWSCESRFRDIDAPKKNVALNDIVFYMVDDTDHVTPKTGLTLTVERYLDGATTGTSVTGTVTEAEDGIYHFDATAADMNGDTVVFKANGTDADQVVLTFSTK